MGVSDRDVSALAGLDFDEIAALVDELGEPPYRARQLFSWIQEKSARDSDALTNLPKALRDRLADVLPLRAATAGTRHDSKDGTFKLLARFHDGETAECVYIPEGDRRTVCISTQVGCGVGCIFCASGEQGVVRNLDAGEIVDQVHLVRTASGGERPGNVVVMGMGEPLHNVNPLVKALRLLQDPRGLDLSPRRITVSTSGPRAGFRELLSSGVKVNLAVSLHAAEDRLRQELVPRGDTGTVQELQGMAAAWFRATRRDVTFEYVLLAGINDRDEDALALARLAGRHLNVNLIPMNPVPYAPQLRAPSRERIQSFVDLLERAGVVVHVRRQRGDDVAAACGQLRLSRAGPAC